MSKILIIGSINQDIVANVSEIPKTGETVIAGKSQMFFGGKGANQAIACSKLGGDCAFIGKVGKDKFGDNSLENLSSNGISIAGISQTESQLTGMAFITVENSGNNSIVVMGNSNMDITFEDILENECMINECDYILMQLEIPYEIVKKVVLLAHEKGKKVILNPAPSRKIDDDILSKLYCITPNEYEVYGILGNSGKNGGDKTLLEAGKKLLEKGIQNIIITMGDKGILHISNELIKQHEAFKVCPVDTTGAGDTFNGALLYFLSEGYSFHQAILNSQGAAALSILKLGAQTSMPDKAELDEFLIKNGHGENINKL